MNIYIYTHIMCRYKGIPCTKHLFFRDFLLTIVKPIDSHMNSNIGFWGYPIKNHDFRQVLPWLQKTRGKKNVILYVAPLFANDQSTLLIGFVIWFVHPRDFDNMWGLTCTQFHVYTFVHMLVFLRVCWKTVFVSASKSATLRIHISWNFSWFARKKPTLKGQTMVK